MTREKYFQKHGFIYGISYKYDFGRWNVYARKFEDLHQAEAWLYTEERDFRTRELVSETAAKKALRW